MATKVSSMTVSKKGLDSMRLLKAQAIQAGFKVNSYDDLIKIFAEFWRAAKGKALVAELAGRKGGKDV